MARVTRNKHATKIKNIEATIQLIKDQIESKNNVLDTICNLQYSQIPIEDDYTPKEVVHTPIKEIHMRIEHAHTPKEAAHAPIEDSKSLKEAAHTTIEDFHFPLA